MTASKSLRQANRNLMSALKQPADATSSAPSTPIIDCAHPAAQASPLYPRLDRNIPGKLAAVLPLDTPPFAALAQLLCCRCSRVQLCFAGPRANKTGNGPKPKKATNMPDLRSISPSVVRRKANAALMSAVDSSTPRARRTGFLKPLDVNILDKENSSTSGASLLLPFTPNANKVSRVMSETPGEAVHYVKEWQSYRLKHKVVHRQPQLPRNHVAQMAAMSSLTQLSALLFTHLLNCTLPVALCLHACLEGNHISQ